MVIPRISYTLLNEVSQYSFRHSEMNKQIAEKNREQNYEEQSKILALQESHRLLRNYNYRKDTEFLNNYVFYESIKEQRLLNKNTVTGIFIDSYV